MPFQKATKKAAKLRMALIGPSGSGKTYTALAIAKGLGGKVAVVDTERGSASKYADLFDFDTLELETFNPEQYITAIGDAQKAGYDVLIIDSLSHAWAGKGGLLEFVDAVAKRTQSSNSFGAWREATPLHNRLVDAMIGARLHVIATMRAKMEYVQEKDERGKTVIRKVGLQPVQRDGLEYEFDVVADLTQDNDLIVSKTRCPALNGKVQNKAGQEIADVLRAWLGDGAPTPERIKATPPAKPVLPKPTPEVTGGAVAVEPDPAVELGLDDLAVARADAFKRFEDEIKAQGRTRQKVVDHFERLIGPMANWSLDNINATVDALKASDITRSKAS